jgi:UDP-galactopyranose mutase
VKAVILGGGFAGCTVAHLLHRAGWQTTLIEKEHHLGGGCRTFFYAGHPFTYGPRVYYGYSQKVAAWLDAVVPIRRFPFELRTYVEADQRFYSYPIHEDDIPLMPDREQIERELAARDNSREPENFDEYWRQRVGPTLYRKFVDGYSKKMWMINDNKIFDIFKWSAKDRPIETGPRGAYKDSIIGYPVAKDGYNGYFERMVDGTEVILGKAVSVAPGFMIDHNDRDVLYRLMGADAIVSTIPIDELCGYALGELPYVGREFSVFILPCKQVFPGDVRFCHYAGSEPWTRITEFKKLTYHESEDTLLVAEKPSNVNKLYPYLTKANMAKVAEYMALLPSNVHSIGRLGTYKYSTIEQTIVQAFQCAAKLLGAPSAEGCEGEWKGIGDTTMMKKDRSE